jgi:hypothetical protein
MGDNDDLPAAEGQIVSLEDKVKAAKAMDDFIAMLDKKIDDDSKRGTVLCSSESKDGSETSGSDSSDENSE